LDAAKASNRIILIIIAVSISEHAKTQAYSGSWNPVHIFETPKSTRCTVIRIVFVR